MNMTKGVFLFLQNIKHTNEIVLAAAAENRQLMLIKADFIYMRQLTDSGNIFFCQSENIDRDDLTFLDQFLEFFCCAKCQVLALIDDGNAGTDLLDFVHIVGGIQNSCPAPIQFDDPFQNFVAALRIDRDGRLI